MLLTSIQGLVDLVLEVVANRRTVDRDKAEAVSNVLAHLMHSYLSCHSRRLSSMSTSDTLTGSCELMKCGTLVGGPLIARDK